jgi:hypothetical protein
MPKGVIPSEVRDLLFPFIASDPSPHHSLTALPFNQS